MKGLTVEIIPDSDQGGFTARVPDIAAYGEGESEEETIADLREALRAYIEAFGVEDALARLNPRSSWRLKTLSLLQLPRHRSRMLGSRGYDLRAAGETEDVRRALARASTG